MRQIQYQPGIGKTFSGSRFQHSKARILTLLFRVSTDPTAQSVYAGVGQTVAPGLDEAIIAIQRGKDRTRQVCLWCRSPKGSALVIQKLFPLKSIRIA
jgi:hypothetical protein